MMVANGTVGYQTPVSTRRILMAIRAVFFDFHFTLAEGTCQLDVEITKLPTLLLQELARMGSIEEPRGPVIVEAEQLYQQVRARMRDTGVALDLQHRASDVLDALRYRVSREEIEDAVATIMDACLEDVKMVAGADLALEELHAHGYKLGIISTTGYTPSVEKALEKMGLRSYFSCIVTSGGEGIYKSNPEIFRRAVSKLGVQPGEAVHVGDQLENDVRPASTAGLKAIWFTGVLEASNAYFRGMWPQDPLAPALAASEVANMGELFATISQLSASG